MSIRTAVRFFVLSALCVLALGLATPRTQAATANSGPVTCQLTDGDLVVSTGAGDLTLQGDWHINNAGKYATAEAIQIVTPAGVIPVPSAGNIRVTCDPYFAVYGSTPGLPDLAGVWPDMGLEADGPAVEFGMALGAQITHLGAPVAPDRPYIYFVVDTQASLSAGAASLSLNDSDRAVVLVDPFDPTVYFEVGGDLLSSATFGFVSSVGVGVSRGGLMRWDSQVDLPTGAGADAGSAPASLNGHAYLSGSVGLIPIPNSPVQLYVDGEILIDAGSYPEAGEAMAAGLLSGSRKRAKDILRARHDLGYDQVMKQAAVGANLRALSLSLGPVSLDLGEGSFLIEDGVFRAAASTWSPTQAPGGDADSGLMAVAKSLGVLSIGTTHDVRAYIDGDDHRFELGADLTVGPVSLDGATLILDSIDGPSVVRPDVEVDVTGFVAGLRDTFDCDFSDIAQCSVGGYPVTAMDASIVDGKLEMTTSLDLFGLAAGNFELKQGNDGSFHLVAWSQMNLGGFATQNTRLELTPSGIEVSTKLATMVTSFKFHGTLTWDGAAPRFAFAGQGGLGFGGVELATVSAEISNLDGPVTLTLAGVLELGLLGIDVAGSFASTGEFDVSGSAEVSFPLFGHLQTVKEGIECGVETVTSALECGTEWAYDAVQCGKIVMECGVETVTDMVRCGSTLVSDALKCGQEYGANAAQCGADMITSGAQCGWSMVKDAVKCGTATATGSRTSAKRRPGPIRWTRIRTTTA